MTSSRQVLVHPDRTAVAESVARRFFGTVHGILDRQETAHLCLTGGTLGIQVLDTIGASPAAATIDWSRVHLWWGDERFVPRGDDDRNELQAKPGFLEVVGVPEAQRHPFPASDEIPDLDEAAAAFADELARFAAPGTLGPVFDLTFLGVGPDGHIASLFPNRAEVLVRDAAVVPVRNSPKPPPERLSLTRPLLNASQRIWLVLAGADKASPIGLALAGAQYGEVPVAGAKGVLETLFFVDEAAAAEVPESLIAPSDEFHALARRTEG